MFHDACRKFCAALRGQFLRLVQADNPSLRIEDHRGGNHRTKQRTSPGFVNAGNARPAQFARGSLETGRAESAHWWEILARGSEPNSELIVAVLRKSSSCNEEKCLDHSYRRATMGSTRMARRAGIQAAKNATPRRIKSARPRRSGS